MWDLRYRVLGQGSRGKVLEYKGSGVCIFMVQGSGRNLEPECRMEESAFRGRGCRVHEQEPGG
jgi:hypothetical protein